MEFGWINLFGLIFVILIMIPNIVYAVRNKKQNIQHNLNKIIIILEQVGRYSCIILMFLPLFVWEFGFKTATLMVLYLIINVCLILGYYVYWFLYSKRKSKIHGLILAIIPTCIFMISGILLSHWLLFASSIIFGFAHFYITYKTHKDN